MKAKTIISLGIVLGLLASLAWAEAQIERMETKELLGIWSEELIEVENKSRREESEIAEIMEKLKSKSVDSLVNIVSSLKDEKKVKSMKDKDVKKNVAIIRILDERIKDEKDKKLQILKVLHDLKLTENREIKREAFFALRKIQLEEKIKYIPTSSLVSIIFDKNKKMEERKEAINVLGLRREEKEYIILILTKALQDGNKEIVMYSALALYKLGKISTALPVLDKFLKEGGDRASYIISGVNGLFPQYDDGLVSGAHMYTVSFEPYNRDAAEILLKRALNYEESICLDAIIWLRALGREEKEIAYQSTIKFLEEVKDPELKYWALFYTYSIRDEKMLKVVEKLSKDKNEKIKEQANKLLQKYYKNRREK